MKKSKRKRIRKQTSGSQEESRLSEKELEILREECSDRNAHTRNIPLLQDLMLREPILQSILFSPTYLPLFMGNINRTMRATSALTGEIPSDSDLFNACTVELSKMFNPYVTLEVLYTCVNETKIKREKRVLLWAIGELMDTIQSRRELHTSFVFRTLVVASFSQSTKIYNEADIILSGREPYNFDYRKVMDDVYSNEDWKILLDRMEPNTHSYHSLLSLRALDLFHLVKKPFGLRFYQIIHYPSVGGETPSRLIVTPNEPEVKNEEDEKKKEEERYDRLFKAVLSDIHVNPLKGLIGETISSVKASAFGEIEPEKLNPMLNAVAFSFMLLSEHNPFMIRLYEESGKQAEKLNPEDELSDIIEIKSSPEKAELYRRYADRLYEKGEKLGAYSVYSRTSELLDGKEEAFEDRIKELRALFDETVAGKDMYFLR